MISVITDDLEEILSRRQRRNAPFLHSLVTALRASVDEKKNQIITQIRNIDILITILI